MEKYWKSIAEGKEDICKTYLDRVRMVMWLALNEIAIRIYANMAIALFSHEAIYQRK